MIYPTDEICRVVGAHLFWVGTGEQARSLSKRKLHQSVVTVGWSGGLGRAAENFKRRVDNRLGAARVFHFDASFAPFQFSLAPQCWHIFVLPHVCTHALIGSFLKSLAFVSPSPE